MSNYRIVQRYAKSLIDLATEQNVLDEIIEDIKLVKDSLSTRELFLMVKSPIVKPSSKRKVFKALYENRVNKMTLAFIDILVRKGRDRLLPEILNGAIDQYREIKGITSIQMITAITADEDMKANVKRALETSSSINEVELSSRVNPDLIGGIILDFGDKRIDASVKHELNLIRKKFASANIKGL